MVYKASILQKLDNFAHSGSLFFSISSKFLTAVICVSFVKQNNDSNTSCRHVHDLKLYHTSVSKFDDRLRETKCEF
jgi:hypothetical protein